MFFKSFNLHVNPGPRRSVLLVLRADQGVPKCLPGTQERNADVVEADTNCLMTCRIGRNRTQATTLPSGVKAVRRSTPPATRMSIRSPTTRRAEKESGSCRTSGAGPEGAKRSAHEERRHEGSAGKTAEALHALKSSCDLRSTPSYACGLTSVCAPVRGAAGRASAAATGLMF
jgi:hypothetical protein